MKIRRVYPILLAVLVLTACQAGLMARPGGSLFRELAGAEFILHRDITITPGRVRVIFQEGVLAHAASEYQPHCELEVQHIMEEPQTVPSGRYRIGKVRGVTHYVMRPDDKLMLAALGDLTLASDSSSEWYMYAYHMTLDSDLTQNALTLICGGAYNYPFNADYPGMQAMQDALGDYATLKLH
ncbi:MAG: hypothetical protein OEN52_06125 [Gammaproteobacteria bacterium]|nr:hypothetical protein [Gammaproteobacteria bacterium]